MVTYPDNHESGDQPSRLAIYLSALVWPGAGQYAQKRWLAGTFCAVIFLVCIVFLFAAIFEPLFCDLRMLMEYSARSGPVVFYPISWAKIMVWTGFAALVYLGSLLDTFVYYKRQQRGRADQTPA
jgi:hypothetical protein